MALDQSVPGYQPTAFSRKPPLGPEAEEDEYYWSLERCKRCFDDYLDNKQLEISGMTDNDRDEQKSELQQKLPRSQPAPRVGLPAEARLRAKAGPASSTDTTYPSRYIFDDYGFIPKRKPRG